LHRRTGGAATIESIACVDAMLDLGGHRRHRRPLAQAWVISGVDVYCCPITLVQERMALDSIKHVDTLAPPHATPKTTLSCLCAHITARTNHNLYGPMATRNRTPATERAPPVVPAHSPTISLSPAPVASRRGPRPPPAALGRAGRGQALSDPRAAADRALRGAAEQLWVRAHPLGAALERRLELPVLRAAGDGARRLFRFPS
jgi:hypothetical protein